MVLIFGHVIRYKKYTAEKILIMTTIVTINIRMVSLLSVILFHQIPRFYPQLTKQFQRIYIFTKMQ